MIDTEARALVERVARAEALVNEIYADAGQSGGFRRAVKKVLAFDHQRTARLIQDADDEMHRAEEALSERQTVGEARAALAPLDWKPIEHAGEEAICPVGSWWYAKEGNVFGDHDTFFASSEMLRRERGFAGDPVFARNLPSAAAAKAACEADYASRVHMALKPSGSARAADREAIARAMYDAWPHTVISVALAELSGLPVGTVLTWEKASEIGADFSGLYRYADAALGAIRSLKPSEGEHAERAA